MGWKPKDGPSNYLLFKRGQRGDCEGNASWGRRAGEGAEGVWSVWACEDAALLSLVSAIKTLISITEVHSGRQLKQNVWDEGDNEKAPRFCFCRVEGGEKGFFNQFYSIWLCVETRVPLTYKWLSFCSFRSELVFVIQRKWTCMLFLTHTHF